MKEKLAKIAIVLAAVLFIGVMTAGTYLTKDREFSENENRYLAKAPELSFDKFLEGDFQRDLESYLNDQILGRDFWISIKTAIQKAIGDTDIGGAYVGKDGYDFEKITPESVNEALIEQNAKAVKTYLDYCQSIGIEKERISFLLIPTSGLVLEDKLPANARLFDQRKYLEEIKNLVGADYYVDVTEELKEASKKEQVYYRTDHHWTSTGALVSYEKWCENKDVVFAGKDAYTKNIVTETFRGSLYSKILDVDSAYDSIWTFSKEKEGLDYEITMDEKEADSFYAESKLEEKDKYTYFFGGNYGETIIKNKNADNGRKLLLVKDSFANCFAPLAAEDFEEIYMIDLRYFKGDMSSYVKEKQITDVLVLYNVSNFITDKNVYTLEKNI